MHDDSLDPVEDAHALADSIAEDRDRLQAIVGKLPKINEFNEDKTAVTQTCPAYPGMTVWVIVNHAGGTRCRRTAIHQLNYNGTVTLVSGTGSQVEPSILFAAPEAAEAGR